MTAEDKTERREAIGLGGNSGFSKARMVRFNMGSFSAFLAAYFIGAVSTLYVSVYRAEGSVIVSAQLFLKLFGGFFGVFMGWLQDRPQTAVCFEKIGCGNQKCGRRAPHAVYATLIAVICTMLVHWPPNIVNMATSVNKDTALVFKDGTVPTKYKFSLDAEGKRWPKTWQAYPNGTNGLLDKMKGFPCGLMMKVKLNDGEFKNFTRINTASTVFVPEYGSDICANLVAADALCFPGPKGAPKVGDGNPRVCGTTDSASLGTWFLIMGVLGRIGWETIWQVSHVAKWEIFPFQQDRVQVNAWGIFTFFWAFLIFVIFNFLISGQSEFGTRPNGANGFRHTLGFIAAALVALGFLAIDPFSEAKQTTIDDQRNSNPLSDYKDLLCGKKTDGFRWATSAYFFQMCHATIYISTVQYYFVYTLNTPIDTAATGIAILAIATIMIDLLSAPLWSSLYGKRHAEDRLKSRDPRNMMLIMAAVSTFMSLVTLPLLARPQYREKFNTNVFLLTICLFLFRAPTSLQLYWQITADGWCIDEDCQNYFQETGKKRRRESVFKGLQLFMRGFADSFVLTVVLSIFASTCDSTIASQNQTMECASSFFLLWMIGLPFCMICMGLSVYMFPITGARRDNAIIAQGKSHLVIGSAKKSINSSDVVTVEQTGVTVVEMGAVNRTQTN